MREKYEVYREVIDEFWGMDTDQTIPNPEGLVLLAESVRISRRSIKHIVESRKADNYSSYEVKDMLSHIPDTLLNPAFHTENANQTYAGSKISGKLYPERREALLVVHTQKDNVFQVITCFYRSAGKFRKMVEQSRK